MSWRRPATAILAGALLVSGCGGSHRTPTATSPPADRPIPIGRGPGYQLSPLSRPSSEGLTIGGLACLARRPRPYAIHLELYARGLVLPVPAGIGVAPPQQRRGAYVLNGRCTYPIRTHEPTGLVLVDPKGDFTLGTLFALWGQPLTLTRLAGFTGPVLAYVDGQRWLGPPSAIPLRRHAQIVLEGDGYVPPHAHYEFPPGV